ncbi:MAG: hypothetical protein VX346_21845 [Planctomycetota bacterium]|nr:hypothetical protein [Planctomycetota bacterium]
MMMASPLEDRRRALEESFFSKKNKQLLDALREELSQADRKQALSTAAQIDDDRTLDLLVQADISVESLLAFKLVPLVEVAWADASIAESEREAILAAAESKGIRPSDVAYQLLQNWLGEPLTEEVKLAWRSYASGLVESLGAEQCAAIRAEVLGKAREVAQSAGGILGIGNKISPVESQVMAELEEAFGNSD